MILLTLDKNQTPEVCLEHRLAIWRQSAHTGSADVFAMRFTHVATYLPGKPRQDLLALVAILPSQQAIPGPEVWVSIFPTSGERLAAIEGLAADCESFEFYCRQQGIPRVALASPLLLEPVFIPKPWGQEVWYTGVEARGQAGVRGVGGNLPLPWVLEFMYSKLSLAAGAPLILLKVLDPLADTPYGDLYFELHQQKQEVYVVTHVDQSAWPDGRGAIQLGFNPKVREQFKTPEEFKQAYLSAVSRYERTRRIIDDLLDEKKQECGIALDQPVSVDQLKLWIKQLSQKAEYQELMLREQLLKKAMDAFIDQHRLGVGDVVAIPRLVPHALQHGVRVVEFQTPVYERKILSFGQKVLTQAHWDTEAALQLVDMDAAPFTPPVPLYQSDQIQVQQIVNFDEFEVQRIVLRGTCQLPVAGYALLMVLEGEVTISGHTLLATGDVALLTATVLPQTYSSTGALLLWAIPRSDTCLASGLTHPAST